MKTASPKSSPRRGMPSPPLSAFHAQADLDTRRRWAEALRREMAAIWSVDLEGPGPDPDELSALLRELSADLDRALDEPGRALLHFLAEDPDDPIGRMVIDLGEILALPREARSEYAGQPPGPPPFRIKKLLLEYAVWAHKLDDLTGALSKDFCAKHCDRLPAGCCTVLGYDMGVTPERMLAAQDLEARLSGWRPPAREDKCRYHGRRGCVLRLFKSPACTGMLCEALQARIRRDHPAAAAEAFLAALADFRNRHLDRGRIFESMARVLETGRALLHPGQPEGDAP